MAKSNLKQNKYLSVRNISTYDIKEYDTIKLNNAKNFDSALSSLLNHECKYNEISEKKKSWTPSAINIYDRKCLFISREI